MLIFTISAIFSIGMFKEYNFFIFDDVLERATKKFCSAYKVSVEESLSTGTEVIAAGFRYKRRNKNGTEYKVVGRLVYCIIDI